MILDVSQPIFMCSNVQWYLIDVKGVVGDLCSLRHEDGAAETERGAIRTNMINRKQRYLREWRKSPNCERNHLSMRGRIEYSLTLMFAISILYYITPKERSRLRVWCVYMMNKIETQCQVYVGEYEVFKKRR